MTEAICGDSGALFFPLRRNLSASQLGSVPRAAPEQVNTMDWARERECRGRREDRSRWNAGAGKKGR